MTVPPGKIDLIKQEEPRRGDAPVLAFYVQVRFSIPKELALVVVSILLVLSMYYLHG